MYGSKLINDEIKKKVRPEEIQKLRQKQQVSEMPAGVVNAQGDVFIEVIKRDKNAKELFNENICRFAQFQFSTTQTCFREP